MPGPFDLLAGTTSTDNIPGWVFEPSSREFMAHRVIGAASREATHAYAGMLYAAGLRARPHWTIPFNDDLHYYYKEWQGSTTSPKLRSRSALAMAARRMTHAATAADLLGSPAEVAERIRTKLYEMAHTEVAADQLAHAERFRNPRTTTHRTGRAAMLDEGRVRMAKDLLKVFGHSGTHARSGR